MNKKTIKLSKLLSLCLRHRPEYIGISLDDHGWADVDDLLEKAAQKGKNMTRDELEKVVKTNDKQRFSFSSDGSKIRANQGHSIKVDLDLEPKPPPKHLYHGTVHRFLNSIMKTGLQKRSRHHVHLSIDRKTALGVGTRRGKPLILKIDSGRMQKDGFVFFRSQNNVWLTDTVPPEYITLENNS